MTTSAVDAVRCGGLAVAAAGALALALSLIAGATSSEKETKFSEANTLLFLTNHLENVSEPTMLRYAFSKRGSLERPYTGTIDMTLSVEPGSAEKTAELRYFSGAQYVPPVPNAEGNPIVLMFLQRDVSDMQQRTGGAARYFQKVMKIAFENQAKVRPVSFDYNGRSVDGIEIKITPYMNDPHRARIGPYADKYYVFTLSEAVPGEVYELRTVVPGGSKRPARGGSEPLLEEVLTLSAVRPLSPNRKVN